MKLDARVLRYMSKEEFRVLSAVDFDRDFEGEQELMCISGGTRLPKP